MQNVILNEIVNKLAANNVFQKCVFTFYAYLAFFLLAVVVDRQFSHEGSKKNYVRAKAVSRYIYSENITFSLFYFETLHLPLVESSP